MLRLLLALLIFAAPVRAEIPAGAEAPLFRAAVQRWLDADDGALEDLVRLASSGNVAAQILLARIERRAHFMGDWDSLPYQETYDRIFRSPRTDGRRGGRRWSDVATERSSLAQALKAAGTSSISEADRISDAVEHLFDVGEYRVAVEPLNSLWNSRRLDELARLAVREDAPPMYIYFWWAAATGSDVPEAAALREELIAAIRSDDPRQLISAMFHVPAQWAGQTSEREDYVRWRAQAEWFSYGKQISRRAAPVAGQSSDRAYSPPDAFVSRLMALPELEQSVESCATLCPETERQCFEAAFAFGGGFMGQLALGTPTETLIPQERYIRSARGRRDLLTSFARHRKELDSAGALAQVVSEKSQCLGGHLLEMDANATRTFR